MHPSTFNYLKPTDEQFATMEHLRLRFQQFADDISPMIPDGPDKTYLLRQLRDVAMWANTAVTRQPDGSPRT